jgi:hypothetical protein
MADTQVLRSNAINRSASVGATPPHGPVKTGELPLVQVKMTPAGPQIHEGQQKAVQILAPNSKGAVAAGGLPMVNVKMTQNGPQLDDGQNNPVVIKEAKHGAVSAGALPMLQVKMTQAGPQVQTLPNVQGGPPQIPAAAPALSAPRVAPGARPAQGYTAHQGYVARPAGPVANQARVTRIAAPAPQAAPQGALPPVPEFSTEQLMLCRHLAEKYVADLRAAVAEPPAASAEAVEESDNVKLALATIATIDDVLVSTAVRAEAAALAAADAAAAPVAPAPVAAPAALSIGAPAAASIAPAPSVAYNAGRVGGARPFVAGGPRAQRNSQMAPRRTGRSNLPPVIVKMEGQQAVVQNRAEVEQAKADAAAVAEVAAAAAAAPADDTIRALGEQNMSLSAENEALRRELEEARARNASATPTEAPPVEPPSTSGTPQG